ncbi:MAG: VIT domain-containing protein, partial [Gemmatimonadales bacterium]
MHRPLSPPRTPVPVPALPFAIVLSLLTPPALLAQGWIDLERRPELTVLPGPVVRVGSEVRISLDGRVAQVAVEEHFRNTGGSVAEGSYLYPLPGEAVFTNFSLWQGDQELRGETMNAEQARRIYEEIVRRRKDPALLTLAGHGLVRAQVFPIQAGETRKVALRYTQLLGRSGDALRLRYALGLRGPEGTTNLRVTVVGSLAHGTPYSPTHQIESRTVGGRLELTVSPGAGGDVELFLPLRRGIAGTSLVTHAPAGEDGYFMLLLAPAAAEQATAVARDLALVVDVSGSMSGAKLEQARAALQQALGTLGSGDRFRLIAFSSAVRPFRPDLVPATRENLAQAREFIAALGAEGGTNIAGALDAALAGPADPERLSL